MLLKSFVLFSLILFSPAAKISNPSPVTLDCSPKKRKELVSYIVSEKRPSRIFNDGCDASCAASHRTVLLIYVVSHCLFSILWVHFFLLRKS